MPGATRRRGVIAVAAASLALAVLWRLLPAASPPLYDGICIADAYRSLGGNPPPGSASKMYPAAAQSPTDEITTMSDSEQPAQAQILMQGGTFSSPTAPYTVSVTPEAPPAPPPSGYTLDGNAYRIVAKTSSGTMLQPTSQNPVTVVLRGTSASNSLTMYVYDGTMWMPLKTFNVGCGYTFESVSTRMGDFGLFYQGSGTGGNNGGGQSGGAPVAVIVGVVLVLIVGVIVAVR
ncbi:MAG: hypothetical protein JOY80_07560, partial [Candidatus Dormibacteraeota bacterium]|nr:hypothetical protein [Candidatus Dormibacteraeota bacterium]